MAAEIIGYRDLGADLKNLTSVAKLTSNTNQDINQALTVGVDVVDRTDFRLESARLDSYATWPLSYMRPKILAAAGFYYTGEEDAVRCFECRLILRKWAQGDDPWADHQRYSSRCRFVRNVPCGNVPIDCVDRETLPRSQLRSPDCCGVHGLHYRPNTVVDTPIQVYFGNTETPNKVSVSELQGAKHPQYANVSDRISTFETWPATKVQTKEQVAEAGFYYTKTGDRTICYYCGGGLEGWEPDDVPLKEHLKWFPKCTYALNKLNSLTSSHI